MVIFDWVETSSAVTSNVEQLSAYFSQSRQYSQMLIPYFGSTDIRKLVIKIPWQSQKSKQELFLRKFEYLYSIDCCFVHGVQKREVVSGFLLTKQDSDSEVAQIKSNASNVEPFLSKLRHFGIHFKNIFFISKLRTYLYEI